MKKYSVIFMGTPDFSVPVLNMLYEENYEIKLVVTQPDKPKGRGKHMAFPPVKEQALKYGLEVYQPVSAKDGQLFDVISKISPDFIITVAYGKILPKDVLDVPKMGSINVHASLLPKYRGPAPIQYSIINGEDKTGITTMYMDEGMDTGDILIRAGLEITNDMTGGQLHDQLMDLGAVTLKETLERLIRGDLKRTPQDGSISTYAPMLDKKTGYIDFSKTAREVYNLVRAMNPWPGAYSIYQGETVKIWETVVLEEALPDMIPGRIYEVTDELIKVACKDHGVGILTLQFPYSKRMDSKDYLLGHKIEKGIILG